MLDGEPYVQPINLTMPCTKDQSGEWNEYHLDLAEYDLPDVMFMGFRFTGTRVTSSVCRDVSSPSATFES